MAISLVGPRLAIHLLVAISNATYQLSKYTPTSIRHLVWFSGHNASIAVPGSPGTSIDDAVWSCAMEVGESYHWATF